MSRPTPRHNEYRKNPCRKSDLPCTCHASGDRSCTIQSVVSDSIQTKNTNPLLNVATNTTSDTDAMHPNNASIENKFDRFIINQLYVYNIFVILTTN